MELDINGRMNKSLLHTVLKTYLITVIVVFIIVAPFFYFSLKKLYLDDVDEALLLRKKEFMIKQLPYLYQKDIVLWNKFNRESKIFPNERLKKDSLFFKFYYDSLDHEEEPYREINVPIVINNKPYIYSDKMNLVESEDLIESITILFLITLILLLITLFFVTKKVALVIWKPFYNTLQQIEKFEIDKMNYPTFSDTDIQEFVRLNQSILKLIEKNVAIYQQQKEFVENASHELQTPVAVIQAKMDTLLQSGDFSKKQYEIITSINENIARLTRLNKNLLLLSKIENHFYSDKQRINLNDLIKKQLDFFIEQAESKDISIITELNENVNVFSNYTLVEILISNLILNAIQHNIPQGKIIIKLTQKNFIVANSGKTQPIPQEKVFLRFSKTDPSAKGNGLGLAIIKKITELNNWQITYSFSEDLHFFTLLF